MSNKFSSSSNLKDRYQLMLNSRKNKRKKERNDKRKKERNDIDDIVKLKSKHQVKNSISDLIFCTKLRTFFLLSSGEKIIKLIIINLNGNNTIITIYSNNIEIISKKLKSVNGKISVSTIYSLGELNKIKKDDRLVEIIFSSQIYSIQIYREIVTKEIVEKKKIKLITFTKNVEADSIIDNKIDTSLNKTSEIGNNKTSIFDENNNKNEKDKIILDNNNDVKIDNKIDTSLNKTSEIGNNKTSIFDENNNKNEKDKIILDNNNDVKIDNNDTFISDPRIISNITSSKVKSSIMKKNKINDSQKISREVSISKHKENNHSIDSCDQKKINNNIKITRNHEIKLISKNNNINENREHNKPDNITKKKVDIITDNNLNESRTEKVIFDNNEKSRNEKLASRNKDKNLSSCDQMKTDIESRITRNQEIKIISKNKNINKNQSNLTPDNITNDKVNIITRNKTNKLSIDEMRYNIGNSITKNKQIDNDNNENTQSLNCNIISNDIKKKTKVIKRKRNKINDSQKISREVSISKHKENNHSIDSCDQKKINNNIKITRNHEIKLISKNNNINENREHNKPDNITKKKVDIITDNNLNESRTEKVIFDNNEKSRNEKLADISSLRLDSKLKSIDNKLHNRVVKIKRISKNEDTTLTKPLSGLSQKEKISSNKISKQRKRIKRKIKIHKRSSSINNNSSSINNNSSSSVNNILKKDINKKSENEFLNILNSDTEDKIEKNKSINSSLNHNPIKIEYIDTNKETKNGNSIKVVKNKVFNVLENKSHSDNTSDGSSIGVTSESFGMVKAIDADYFLDSENKNKNSDDKNDENFEYGSNIFQIEKGIIKKKNITSKSDKKLLKFKNGKDFKNSTKIYKSLATSETKIVKKIEKKIEIFQPTILSTTMLNDKKFIYVKFFF